MNEYSVEIFLPGYGWDKKAEASSYSEALSKTERMQEEDDDNDMCFSYRIKDSNGEVLYES